MKERLKNLKGSRWPNTMWVEFHKKKKKMEKIFLTEKAVIWGHNVYEFSSSKKARVLG